ncbi:MAG: hypothetical protein AAGB01_04305 [Cyanobacteria bacterium P01_F01_bin.42]
MNSRLLPAEHLFGLTLNLTVIAVSAASISQMVPRFLNLQAKSSLLHQETKSVQQHLHVLEEQVRQNRQNPHRSARTNANLTKENSVSIFFED